MRGAPRSATVIASCPCELLQVNLKMIQRLQWLYPPMALTLNFNVLNILCDKLERSSQNLVDNSFIDDMTGLWNRRTFMENLSTETYRSKRYHSDLTLCLLQLNENGAPSGEPKAGLDERLLRSLSSILSRGLRKSDGLGRLDDAKFAFMFPQTKANEARAIVNRAVESLQATVADQGWPQVKLAMGLAGYQAQADETADELCARAEQDLHDLADRHKPI